VNKVIAARLKTRLSLLIGLFALVVIAAAALSCGGGSSSVKLSAVNGMGTVNVSLSDPPSCMPPNGIFSHVFITVRSVQVNTSATAGDGDSGWMELAPQLASAPVQIDLFSQADTNCVLAQLGSASLPVGSLQQIRLILESNSPGSAPVLGGNGTNNCAGNGFNCVVLGDGSIHELLLSSEANTGLKIPPGQIVGGPIQVMAGQSVDLNIDFNACASIVQEGNGAFRLKPALTAGVVSQNNSGIGGQVVDSVTKKPINGAVQVAIEQPDNMGIDRIVQQATADSNGNFRFCPLPTGMFDVVVVALGPNNLPFNATAILNIPNGTNLGNIALVAETGAAGPAILQGFVTATTGTALAIADVSLSALQSVALSGGGVRQLTIPLQTTQATMVSPGVASTGTISVDSNKTCPVGSPANTNCAQYTLVVPASNPSFAVFAAGSFALSVPAAPPIPFSVDARASVPMSGGKADCSKAEIVTSKDNTNATLVVTPAMTTTVARTDFMGCS